MTSKQRDTSGASRGREQATDPRTGRDEDDHPVVTPRTGSVYEEDAEEDQSQPSDSGERRPTPRRE